MQRRRNLHWYTRQAVWWRGWKRDRKCSHQFRTRVFVSWGEISLTEKCERFWSILMRGNSLKHFHLFLLDFRLFQDFGVWLKRLVSLDSFIKNTLSRTGSPNFSLPPFFRLSIVSYHQFFWTEIPMDGILEGTEAATGQPRTLLQHLITVESIVLGLLERKWLLKWSHNGSECRHNQGTSQDTTHAINTGLRRWSPFIVLV